MDLRRLSPDARAALFIATIVGLSVIAKVARRDGGIVSTAGFMDTGAMSAELDSVRRAGKSGGKSRARSRKPSPKADGQQKADVRIATAAEFDELPGVTTAAALSMVEARARGQLKTLEDLAQVKGIGTTRAAKLVPYLTGLGQTRPAIIAPMPEPPAASVTHASNRPRGSHDMAFGAGSGADAGAGSGNGPGAGSGSPPRRRPAPAVPSPSPSPRPEPGRQPVNINLASAQQLESLPGVGPSLALRIIEARTRKGRLSTMSDLDAVPGIGPALLRRLDGQIVF